MSVIGNPITLGGGSSDVCVTFAGRTTANNNSSTIATALNSSVGVYGGYDWADGKTFEILIADDKNSQYTCLKSGTYQIDYYVKGGYDGSGNFRQTVYGLSVNGSLVESGVTSTSSGIYGTWTVTLQAGDVIRFEQVVRYTSTLNVNGAAIIRKL